MTRHRPHLYVPAPWDDTLGLPERMLHHLIRVLRGSPGMAVSYTDGAGVVGEGIFDGRRVVRGPERSEPRQTPSLKLAVAPPRSVDRVRAIVEKAAELAVHEVWWLTTRFTEGRVPRPDKVDRWLEGALEQSRGAWLPTITGPHALDVVAASGAMAWVMVPGGASPAQCRRDLVVCVGPEGGFAPDELPCEGESVRHVGVGRSILRVDTAATAAITLAEHHLGWYGGDWSD